MSLFLRFLAIAFLVALTAGMSALANVNVERLCRNDDPVELVAVVVAFGCMFGLGVATWRALGRVS